MVCGNIFKREYGVAFQVLRREIGLWNALKVVLSAICNSLKVNYKSDKQVDEIGRKKAEIKNHLKLLAFMHAELLKRFEEERVNEIIHKILIEAGQAFCQGFTPLDAGQDLTDFIGIYKKFESRNIIFAVVEESEQRFETVVSRCLIYEALKELGLRDITPWMCDVATEYFRNYHPNIKYLKDRMIARGDSTCHEIFIWQD